MTIVIIIIIIIQGLCISDVLVVAIDHIVWHIVYTLHTDARKHCRNVKI